MAVVIEDGLIRRVAPDAEVPVLPGDWEVSCRGRLVMPGLVDCHAHLVGDLLVPTSGRAQGTSQKAIELSRGVTQSLLHLQELWLQWVSAFYQGDRESAAQQVEELSSSIARMGFDRLPDLSVAITVRAVEAARQGDLTRAAWALVRRRRDRRNYSTCAASRLTRSRVSAASKLVRPLPAARSSACR